MKVTVKSGQPKLPIVFGGSDIRSRPGVYRKVSGHSMIVVLPGNSKGECGALWINGSSVHTADESHFYNAYSYTELDSSLHLTFQN